MSTNPNPAPAAAAANEASVKMGPKDDGSKTPSDPTKKKRYSRAYRGGRRGDPRMNKAVEAKLANPEMSLFEALRIGGFKYPEEPWGDTTLLDEDNITLGQRKNQLLRRIRYAKDHGFGMNAAVNLHAAGLIVGVPPALDQATKRRLEELTLPNESVEALDTQEELAAKRQRMAKFHPQYHPLFVTPASGFVPPPAPPPPSTSLEALEAIRELAGIGALPPLNNPHPPSGVAVASLNNTATSAGLTLAQLASALSCTPQLGKVLAAQAIPDTKERLALDLFQSECGALYERCMRLAGYQEDQVRDTSLTYKKFAFKAWSEEGQRLEQHFGHLNSA